VQEAERHGGRMAAVARAAACRREGGPVPGGVILDQLLAATGGSLQAVTVAHGRRQPGGRRWQLEAVAAKRKAAGDGGGRVGAMALFRKGAVALFCKGTAAVKCQMWARPGTRAYIRTANLQRLN
jgi:hypothetical protein